MTVVDIHFMGVIMCSFLGFSGGASLFISPKIFVVLFKARRMVVAVDA